MNQNWQAVWTAIEERRVFLTWSKETLYTKTQTSDGTYRKMRAGTPVSRPENVAKICIGLGWTRDSIDRILAGKPAVLAKPAVSQSGDVELRLSELTALVAELSEQVEEIDVRLRTLQATVSKRTGRASS